MMRVPKPEDLDPFLLFVIFLGIKNCLPMVTFDTQ